MRYQVTFYSKPVDHNSQWYVHRIPFKSVEHPIRIPGNNVRNKIQQPDKLEDEEDADKLLHPFKAGDPAISDIIFTF